MFRLRMIGRIVRQAGLGHITAVFAVLFFACAGLVCLFERPGADYSDALWLCFQTVTTIGFGDVAVESAGARVALAVLSIVSVFYLAVITGVVVAYCNQLVKAQAEESVARIVDKLERLDRLDRDELAELSRQLRGIRIGRGDGPREGEGGRRD